MEKHTLTSIAAQLDKWAKESRDGGWSTHQIDPMRKLADQLRRQSAENETTHDVSQNRYKEDMIALLEWVKQEGFKPVDFSDKPNWMQVGSKNGWLQGGMSIIKPSKYLVEEYLQSLSPVTETQK